MNRRTNRIMVASVAALAGTAMAQNDPTVIAGFNNPTDTVTKYMGHGTVQNSKGNNPATSIVGAMTGIGAMRWRFRCAHDVGTLTAANAIDVVLKLDGEHHAAPHRREVLPNPLPEIRSKAVKIPAGKSANLFMWAGVPHPEGEHIDFYSAGAFTRNITLGAATTITSDTEVNGLHASLEDNPYKDLDTAGGLAENGSGLEYDPAARVLLVHIRAIDVLDRVGGLTRSVDPIFGADPMLGAEVIIGAIPVLEDDGTGTFVTGPSRLSVEDPELHRFGMSAELAPTRIVAGTPVQFRLISGAIGVEADPDRDDDAPVSAFLVDFGNTDVLGRGVDNPDGRAMVLTIEMPPDFPGLIEATDGFRREARLSASVFISSTLPFVRLCPADFNADGGVDSQDFFDFLVAFFSASDSADINEDGAVNSQDFFDFLSEFFAGCP